ncbi:MAG: rhodanese-like domain-containing protein [Verrucomicrobiota bacterium]
MKRWILAFLLVVSTVGAETSKVTIEEAEKLIEKKVQVLDVRTEEEWSAGHLEGAVRVDVLEDDFAEKVVEAVDPKKPVLVYCRSGGRSARAAKQLEKLGFVRISDLDGGITAWKGAGKKVVK